jgi:hypothetical protein
MTNEYETDRAREIIEQLAATAANKAGVSSAFFMVQMNYRALLPQLRGLLSADGVCTSCGRKFSGEHDIRFDYVRPPRADNDWERLHVRNLHLCCTRCSRSKRNKTYEQWLDDQEAVRRWSAEVERARRKK